ncbi:MAG TPA: type IV pilus secretin PilQ [Methylophilaceae bacterium]|nr:type IV pilus secretin PilQ [Methylophilaceae bacterium]
MNKLTKKIYTVTILSIFLTGCLKPMVTKEDVVNNPIQTREEVLKMISESPMQGDGLTVINPKNVGAKRSVIEIEGDQKGVKFRDALWQDYPISLNVNVIPIRKFFHLLEKMTEINFVIGDEVTGNLSMRVKDVNWLEVFNMVLREKGLIHDVNASGNVITVHTHEVAVEQSKAYKAALESKIDVVNSLSGLETKTTAIFKLNYTKPDVLAKQLRDVISTLEAGGDASGVEQRATFVIDSRTNSLIVQASPSDIEWIKTTIDNLDQPTKQVMVEVFIVEASDGFEEKLGSSISLYQGPSNRNILGEATFSGNGGTPPTAPGGITTASSGGTLASNIISGATGGIIGLFAGNTADLRLELQAMEKERLVTIVSNPKLFIIDNETATITDGTDIPYQLAAQAGSTPTTSFVTAALQLEVTPSIIPDGNVYMDIKINKDSPLTGSNPPPISKKMLTTKLLIEDGGVAMIGGIIKGTKSTADSGIPFFKDLPGIGHFFKSRENTDSKDHLYIFIAPTVL